MERAPGFVIYRDKQPLLNCLSDEQAGRVVKAAFTYADTGELPQLEQGEMIVLLAIKGDIDRSAAKYQSLREKNRQNAKKRWGDASDATAYDGIRSDATDANKTKPNKAKPIKSP